ncbi:hypothetical protein CHS0354_017096 [Potamilus streckersoni]|uniref:Uncharacterized protein n=1 Tax=Potamilus streckersoni TaxID=2493646 RepID=A0AAE0SBU9_9BIVA|nr:hypothetical protein CHS0354_017096 [Potamilus streckersoni]
MRIVFDDGQKIDKMNLICLVSILLYITAGKVKCQCANGVTPCNWYNWEEWSPCKSESGGGTKKRFRILCCDKSVGPSIDACFSHCKKNIAESKQTEWYWPGTHLLDSSHDCHCTTPFERNDNNPYTHCDLTSNHAPDILTCRMGVTSSSGEAKNSTPGSPSSCINEGDTYIKFQPKNISFVMESSFTVTINMTPKYVYEHQFGVVEKSVTVTKVTLQGSRTENVTTIINPSLFCTTVFSDQLPATTLASCSETLPTPTLRNGERLCLVFTAFGGGFFKTSNLQSHSVSGKHLFRRTKSSQEKCFRFDDAKPVHCSVSSKCSNEAHPLYVSQRITENESVNISFDGWEDPTPLGGHKYAASGLDKFIVHLHYAKELDSSITTGDHIEEKEIQKNITMHHFIFPKEPAIYIIKLEVHDVAGNVQETRRVVLYDKSSTVKIDHAHPLVVKSASRKTNHTWQTNHGPLCLDWTKRYYNSFHRDTNCLNRIAVDNSVSSEYDQISGPLPINGTLNVDGIIMFKYQWEVDHNYSISDLQQLDNVTDQSFCKHISLSDGQTINFLITPIDINNRSLTENITLHIDASGPEIYNIWILKGNHRQLYVHDSSDLSKMNLSFEAMDKNSGLYSIEWRLGTQAGHNDVGSGSIAVHRHGNRTACNADETCYCPMIGVCENFSYMFRPDNLVERNTQRGQHNRDYFITIIVTNNARLVTVEELDILIDDSPPATGVIEEGSSFEPDLDYASGGNITLNWDGFLDHESGIKLYSVGIANRCLTLEELQHKSTVKDSKIIEIKDVVGNVAHFLITTQGHYFSSIIAYNNAMRPSVAVCSDGFTIDSSPPLISNMVVKYAKCNELIACEKDMVYLIREDLIKIPLRKTNECEKKCKSIRAFPFLSSLPIGYSNSDNTDVADDLCQRLPGFSEEWFIYMPSSKILMECSPTDNESQIISVEVGFSSDSSQVDVPDIEDYTTLHVHSKYTNNHAGFNRDKPFYLILKVENKAQLKTIVAFGPIVIDETAPYKAGSLGLFQDFKFVYCWWKNDTFLDPEQKQPVDLVLYRIGVNNQYQTPILETSVGVKCPVPNVSGCIRYPIQYLQQHNAEKNLDFYFEMYVYNKAGHSTTVRSDTFNIPSMYPPGQGIVLDIDPMRNDTSTDVDFVMDGSTICALWTGFRHHLNVTFEVGLGRLPGIAEAPGFKTVFSETMCFLVKDLTKLQKYYITVRANCTGGSTVSSSDGFVVVNETDIRNALLVEIGETCDDVTSKITCHTSLKNCTSQMCSIQCDKELIEKHIYTVQSNGSIQLNITSPDIILLTNKRGDHSISFRSFTRNPLLLIHGYVHASSAIEISLLPCAMNQNYHMPSDILYAHWSIEERFSDIITYYDVSLYRDGCLLTQVRNTTCMEIVVSTQVPGSKHDYMFRNVHLLDEEIYIIGIKPCLGFVCSKEVLSESTMVKYKSPISGSLQAMLSTANLSCSIVHIEWQNFLCLEKDRLNSNISYQWSIALKEGPSGFILPWRTSNIIRPNDDVLNVHECIDLPLYPQRRLFACVRGMCEAGTETVICSRTEPHLTQIDDEYIVLDIDSDNPVFSDIQKIIHSKYIGSKLADIFELEIDFCRERTRIAGLIVSAGEREITWSLMKEKHSPIGECDDDYSCVMSKNTSSGFVMFSEVRLIQGTTYYICAVSDRTVVHRELFHETLEKFDICSNGVFVDESPPSDGKVRIENQDNGYLRGNSDIAISWSMFTDSAFSNWYATSIHHYSYAIGKYSIHHYSYFIGITPGGQEIVPYTNVGYSTSVIYASLNLTNGATCYASVKATDFAGLSTISVSPGVSVDITSPISGRVTIGNAKYSNMRASYDTIRVHWEGFSDPESGISTVYVGIGSLTGKDDIFPFKPSSSQHEEFSGEKRLIDGHRYFATVKVFNRAGLMVQASSDAFLVDTSPPEGGVVSDGNYSQAVDVDFDRELDQISSHWYGFHDPHSGIAYYKIGIGTQKGIYDVEPLVDVHLRTDNTWKGVFTPGVKYFTTVVACNGAGLCTKRYSDGIILDNSPPVPGIVHVGLSNGHERYQSHNNTLSAQWIGFNDPQSDIHHFEYCITKNRIRCDVLHWTNCLMSNTIFRSGLNMPVDKPLLVRVRAFNHVGLSAETASSPFQVDDTAPILKLKPHFVLDKMQVSNRSGSQWEDSLLRLQWKFQDNESKIRKHIIKLITHHNGHVEQETVELANEDKVTIHLLDKSRLISGDRYTANVTACNGAGLCVSASTEPLLIDSTPPHLGGFRLPMTWNNIGSGSNIALSWYGFKDVESSLDKYFIQIGRTYSDDELSRGSVIIDDDGTDVQNASIFINARINPGDEIVLTLWATNIAGLRSHIGKATVTAISTNVYQSKGILKIQRHSCISHYCNNDCTCAVIGGYCDSSNNGTPCVDLTSENISNTLSVVQIYGGMGPEHQNLSASSSCISGHWIVDNNGKRAIMRYEWSIGVKGGKPGEDVFHVPEENPWTDVGKEMHVIHCLKYPKQFTHGKDYVIYTKAWYSSTSFKIYQSPSIKIDMTPPSVRKGKFIMDSLDNCKTDAEYMTSLTLLSICWAGVFQESDSSILKYELMAGITPYSDDFYPITDVNLLTRLDFHNLTFVPGVRYFFTVRVTNTVGLMTSLSSDGILYDDKPPFAGQVFNSDKFRNINFQSSISELGFSWHGFGDQHSFIRNYFITIDDISTNKSILPHTNIGIQNKILFRNLRLTHGHSYVGLVHSVDASGRISDTVKSREVRIDSSEPVGFICEKFVSLNWDSYKEGYINLTRDKFYKIKAFSTKQMSDQVTISIGRHKMHMHFAKNHNGTSETEFNFLSPYDGNTTFNIMMRNRNNFDLKIQWFKCTNMIFSPNMSSIDVNQVGPATISVCLRTLDPDSGIKSVLVGTGTTKYGFQIQPLLPMPSENHLVLPLTVPHGSPVFVTAMTWNYAGLMSTFTSDAITVDHTPPDIQNVTAKVEVENLSNTANIFVTWRADDLQSGIKMCYCGLGEDPGSTSLRPLRMAQSNERCDFLNMSITHGKTVFPLVFCVNTVELSSSKCGKGIVVSYRSPLSDEAKVWFTALNNVQLSTVATNLALFQSNVTTLMAHWNGFQDLSGVSTYQCKLLKDGNIELDNLYTERTSLMLRDLMLKDGSEYQLQVVAVNAGKKCSQPIICNITVNSRGPVLTGNSSNVTSDENEVEFSWTNVFDSSVDQEIFFNVRLGSREGHADILQLKDTRSYSVRVSRNKLNNNVWLYIRGSYDTGESTIYREMLII